MRWPHSLVAGLALTLVSMTSAQVPPGKVSPRIDPKKLPSAAALAARRGDAAHGKQLVADSRTSPLQCLKCHTIRGDGGIVGPDLSAVGKRASRQQLVEAILTPSKAIAPGYLTQVIETKKGQVFSGIAIEDTPDHVLLRDGTGRDTKLLTKDIEARAKEARSLMKDNLCAALTEADLVDVVEYLATLTTPLLEMDYWHVVGPFDNGPKSDGLDRVFAPEKAVNLKGAYLGKGGKVRWATVRPDAEGYVDLQALLAPNDENSVSYLYRRVESPGEQEATVQLGTDEGAKLWINGNLVYTHRTAREVKPAEDSVKVKLQKGPNAILLKVSNVEGPHGFYLRLVSEQPLRRLEEK